MDQSFFFIFYFFKGNLGKKLGVELTKREAKKVVMRNSGMSMSGSNHRKRILFTPKKDTPQKESIKK